MANYYFAFSALVPCSEGSPERAWLLRALDAEGDASWCSDDALEDEGILSSDLEWLMPEWTETPGGVVLSGDESYQTAVIAAHLLKALLQAHHPDRYMLLEGSWWCDKPRVDAFRGDIFLVTAETVVDVTADIEAALRGAHAAQLQGRTRWAP